MIDQLPRSIPLAVIVICACFFTFWIVGAGRALRQLQHRHVEKVTAVVAAALLAWLALQAALSLRGFYLNVQESPFRLLLAVGPPLASLPVLLVLKPTRTVLQAVPLSLLTYMHAIRIPVELVLWILYRYEKIPRLMTFAGRNPDIVIGLSAPLIGYLCMTRKSAPPSVALVWHVIGLLLLANVSALFLLSVPTPFQMLEGDHPNIALLYFPFSWVPAFGVPSTFLAHLTAIIRLSRIVRPRRESPS